MTTITIPPAVLSAHRVELALWLRANGITPGDVPLHHPIRVEEGDQHTVIHYRTFVLTADGHRQLDPDNPDQAWTEPHAAPCTTPLPDLALLSLPPASQ